MAVTDIGQVSGLAWARSAGSSFTGNQLAELQEWQAGKKDQGSKPVRLEATTGPGWKSSYGPGEKLSLEGLTLTIHYDDGSEQSFQRPFDDSEWQIYPAEGTEIYTPTEISCTYGKEGNHLSTTVKIAYTLRVTVEGPTRKEYALGEKLSLAGLVVKARSFQPGGKIEEVLLPEKLGAVTEGYELALDFGDRKLHFTSETIPTAPNAIINPLLEISFNGYEKYVKLSWM